MQYASLHYRRGSSVDKAKLQYLISILIDSDVYLSIPVHKRMLLLSKLTKSYPFLFSLVECDENAGIKELSWLEIFQNGAGDD